MIGIGGHKSAFPEGKLQILIRELGPSAVWLYASALKVEAMVGSCLLLSMKFDPSGAKYSKLASHAALSPEAPSSHTS